MSDTTFGTGAARSGAITSGIALVLVVETVAIHLFVVSRIPWLAWMLTSLSVLTLGWLALDWRAMGQAGVTVLDNAIEVHVGRRWRGSVPRARLTRAIAPEWRHIPEQNTELAREYVNLTRPADPNVLLLLDEAVPLTGPMGIVRRARLVGLHADDPVALLEALGAPPHVRPRRVVLPAR